MVKISEKESIIHSFINAFLVLNHLNRLKASFAKIMMNLID
jgi:hypothetical protein